MQVGRFSYNFLGDSEFSTILLHLAQQTKFIEPQLIFYKFFMKSYYISFSILISSKN